MRWLSIPAERGDLWIRLLIPAAVGMIFLAVLLAERGPATIDLQLIAPREALSGVTIPLRAYVFELGDGNPVALDASITVALKRGSDVLATTTLDPSSVFGREGGLIAPEGTEGELMLWASAMVGEEQAAVAREITIGPEASETGRRGRLQTDLQRYTLFPPSGDPPDALEARALGGDCSAPGPCELRVWVGEPPAGVALVDVEGGTVAPRPECNGQVETSGVVRCAIETTNNEATITVAAYRGQVEVGRRRIQLPMGLAAPELTLDSSSLRVRRRHEEEGALIVDLFYEGRWQGTATLEPEDSQALPPFPGLWRVQARADAFGSDHAATRLFMPNATPAQIAQHPRQNEWLDPMALAHRRGEFRCEPADSLMCSDARLAEFMLAAGELEVAVVPSATSGAAQVNAGLHDTHQDRRGWAALLIALAGFFVAMVVIRRGLQATQEARRIIAISEGEARLTENERPPWGIYASAGFVMTVFGTVALMVLSRGCL
ncbi:MAG: hypothetical protein AAGE52_07555 [Myxococcota bacterium]